MKKLLIFLCLFPLLAFGQGKNLANRFGNSFNILDYGAHPGDGVEDATAIQKAINLAYAKSADGGWTSMGGVVVIPPGVWDITKPDTLKSFIDIEISKGALFMFPASYSGKMWVVNGTVLENMSISGGNYLASDAAQTWTLLDLNSTSTTNKIVFCKFSDMTAIYPKYGINLNVLSDGWINANTFRDFVFLDPLSAIRTRASEESSGLDQNRFQNIDIQYHATTEYAIDSLTGSQNQFTDVFTYDATGINMDAYITADAGYTNFIGGNIHADLVKDDGLYTRSLTSMWNKQRIDTLQVNYKYITPYTTLSSVVAGTGITVDMLSPFMLYTQGSAVDITADPQIAPGYSGETISIQGRSNANTLTLDDGTGLSLSSQCVLGLFDVITLRFDYYSYVWVEVSRSNK